MARLTLAFACSAVVSGFHVAPRSRATSRLSAAAEDEDAQLYAEAEQIAKKKRSNMFNSAGVAYAPWMLGQVDEEATNIARAMRADKKRKQRKELEEAQGTVNILDAATSELSGIGLKATVGDGEVELVWGTSNEEGNKGFVLEKKRVGVSAWEEVASYASWSPLKSKGSLGGAYTYVDVDVDEGEWLYRVVAEQVGRLGQELVSLAVSRAEGGWARLVPSRGRSRPTIRGAPKKTFLKATF